MFKRLLRALNFRQKGREDVLWQLANSAHNVDRWLAENPTATATARWINRDVYRAFAGVDYDTRGHVDIENFRDMVRRGHADRYKG